ncbi:MAG: hypothetical protein AAF483_24355, partial [Planctomycetota bacterium]
MSTASEEFEQLLAKSSRKYDAVVQHLVQHLGASGAVVWECCQEPYRIVAQHYSGKSVDVWFTKSQHESLLREATQNQRPAVVSNDAIRNNGNAPPILLAPISGQADLPNSQKIIEVVFASAEDISDPAQKLNQLVDLCDVVTNHVSSIENSVSENVDAGPGPSTRYDLQAFAQFSKMIHRSIDPVETCLNIVNEARTLTGCDRVSVLSKKHSRFRLQAISGQPSVNRRSTTVQSIEKLAAEILKSGNDFWFPNEGSLAPQIELALEEYFATSSSRSIAILPFGHQ